VEPTAVQDVFKLEKTTFVEANINLDVARDFSIHQAVSD
jgi:hypothetical protein